MVFYTISNLVYLLLNLMDVTVYGKNIWGEKSRSFLLHH